MVRRLLHDLERMRGLVVTNPKARRGEARAEIAKVLRDCGLDVLSVEASSLPQAHAAVSFHREHIDFLAVAGGDGTASSVLEIAVRAKLPLGLLPLGTANDLARTLAIPTDLEQACRVIAGGRTRAVDLGTANGHYFANAAGIGLQPEVARHASPTSKRWLGPLAYIVAAGQAWRHSRPFRSRIEIAGREPQTLDSIQLTVANGRYFGGGMLVDSEATIDDSLLHLLHIEPVSALQLLSILPRLYRGTESTAQGTWVADARALDVHTDRKLAVSLDGEPWTHTPVRFEIAPAALQVFIPDDAEDRTDGLSAAG